jgi:hypothetical protein
VTKPKLPLERDFVVDEIRPLDSQSETPAAGRTTCVTAINEIVRVRHRVTPPTGIAREGVLPRVDCRETVGGMDDQLIAAIRCRHAALLN